MPGLEKIHLEDALEDNPQTRSMVALFEQDAELLKNYVEILRSHCEKVLTAQRELAAATSSLAQHLRMYETQPFPLDTDPDSVLKSTLREFAVTLDEVSSLQQVCASQLGDGMLFPLNRFIEADLTEIFTMTEMFSIASSEMEHTIVKFCKAPKRRDNEKVRQDVNEEVYMATKKFHQMSLHYYANLNALQYKRKIALLEPMLGYLHALRSTFSVGHEALNTPELDTFLSNIGSSVQGVQAELGQETQHTVELIDTIEQQSQHLYYAEPPVDMPYIPPNTSLTQKSGYLFFKTKFAGMVTKWEHIYVYTLGGHLMIMGKDDVAGCVVMELDRTVTAQALEQEDRRNVFQISNGKKTIVLQAVNERERDEWIATLNNIAKETFSNRDRSGPIRQASKDKTSQINTIDKIHQVPSITSSNASNDGDVAKASSPPTPPSSPMDNLLLETPIQFDMFSPAEDRERSKSQDSHSNKANPYDQSATTLLTESAKDKSSAFRGVFAVRFLGSMQVQRDRGEYLVYQTIRHIMAARAIHNIFKMNESHMVITHQTLKILDPSHQAIRATFPLEDISFWTTHKENNRLLGFITRSKSHPDSSPTFHCHVFEAQPSADEICSGLSTAANIALQALLEQAVKEEVQNAVEDKEQIEKLPPGNPEPIMNSETGDSEKIVKDESANVAVASSSETGDP